MDEVERKLLAGCNLIRAQTHEYFRRPEDGKVFVKDRELYFDFSSSNPLTQAGDAAREAFNSSQGCVGCPLYSECLPSPEVISNFPMEGVLVPALLTSFE